MTGHEPVMVAEAVRYLDPSRGGVFVDATVGAGGHARAILEAGADRLLGLDRDESALAVARLTLAAWRGRLELVHADYRTLADLLDHRGLPRVDGILADLGVSSMQLSGEGRGFSFLRDEALDMRMDRSQGPTAAELIEHADEAELARVIHEYGEERHSRRVARALVAARARASIATTGQLAAIVRRVVPRSRRHRIDPATRTFQALRIWVNRELEGLDRFLQDAAARLAEGARLVVISFHSLEDRIVKHTFRALESIRERAIRVLTRRPIVPTDDERHRNPRARSAKMRVAERLA